MNFRDRPIMLGCPTLNQSSVDAIQLFRGRFVVQAGAFSVESNALGLQSRLARIGQPSFVDRENGGLYRVRIGPFSTRDEAVKAARVAFTVERMPPPARAISS